MEGVNREVEGLWEKKVRFEHEFFIIISGKKKSILSYSARLYVLDKVTKVEITVSHHARSFFSDTFRKIILM